MGKLLEGFMILLLILMFFSLSTVFLWILKLILALAFLATAYEAIKEERWGKAIIFLILGLLFQPIIDIGLGRTVWYVIQVVVIIWLLNLIFRES